jgi:hypothetical protein
MSRYLHKYQATIKLSKEDTNLVQEILDWENLTDEQIDTLYNGTYRTVLYQCQATFTDGHIAVISLNSPSLDMYAPYTEAEFYLPTDTDSPLDYQSLTGEESYFFGNWVFELDTTESTGNPARNLYTVRIKPYTEKEK